MKTIREISENTGISKVSLYKLIKKPEMERHVKKDGTATFIDDIGEQIIIEYYSRQRLTSLNDILNESTEESNKLAEDEGVNHVNNPCLQGVNEAYSPDFMRILENQLKEKDNQIQTKDEQIRQKDNQLNALLILLNKEKDIRLISDSQHAATETPPEPREGLFKRLFKKSKAT